MAKVFKLGIAANNNQPIKEVNSIEVLAGKGVVGDRHFHDFNDPYNQLSLIESENIDEYNFRFGLNIPYKDFRRNVITKGISLNILVGKEILIGEVRLKVHDLCEPCRYLQELLGEKNLVKKLLNRGGLRCELLTNGNINVNDPIKIG